MFFESFFWALFISIKGYSTWDVVAFVAIADIGGECSLLYYVFWLAEGVFVAGWGVYCGVTVVGNAKFVAGGFWLNNFWSYMFRIKQFWILLPNYRLTNDFLLLISTYS